MPDPFITGRYYEAHSHKGKCIVFVESWDENFVYTTLVEPLQSRHQLEAGQRLTLARNTHSFVLVKEKETL